MVKKIVFVLAAALSVVLGALIVVANTAWGQTVRWARIEDDDVYLFATESDKQRCFALEKSYYVEILDETERMYFVSVMQNEKDFPKITGYVFKSQVVVCAVPPIAPYYPTVKVTVKGGSAPIRLSPVSSANALLTATNSQQLSYYGATVSEGVTYFYVWYGGSFGYVDSSLVTAPVVPLHPTPLVQKPVSAPPSDDDTTPQQQEQSAPASEILLTVFVVVLAVGLTLALFLPGNFRKKKVFDQDI